MSDPVVKKKGGLIRTAVVGLLGLGGGALGTYTGTVVEKFARAPLPVANFAAAADGLTLTCQNHATGDTGWWDFGDGTALEPFAPDQPAVTHAYAKPGSYSVKLVVRNLTADENERTVAVQVDAAGKDAPAAPRVLGFAVQAVSPVSVAPATFRLTADVQNADRCVWDFGDGRLEVADGGKIDRLVTFDKPGSFPVQLVAHNATAAAKQTGAVKVDAPAAGTLMAVLKVTDTGTKVERASRSETVAVPGPKDKEKATGFTKTVAARAGWALAGAVPVKADVPGVKNLKVTVAADKKSATVAGDWADPKAGKAGGSDVLVALKLTEERATATAPAVTVVTGLFLGVTGQGGAGLAPLPLPPVPAGMTGCKRELALEVRQFTPTGPAKVLAAVPLAAQAGGAPLWSAVINLGSAGYRFQARQDGDTIRVSYAGQ